MLLSASCLLKVIDAWKEAYAFLADILIKREQELYDEKAKRTGKS